MNHQPILAVAPNGAYKQKADHPALPLSTVEIVECAKQVSQAGATLFHLHVRDQANQHSLDPEIYIATIDALQTAVGNRLIIQITSESAKKYTPAEQIQCIKQVNPQCVSIAIREILPKPSDTQAAQALFDWCAEQQTRIQYILYNEAELQQYLHYIQTGLIPKAPHSVLFVLGRYHQNRSSSSKDLAVFTQHKADFTAPWMVCAFGATEQKCLLDAARAGGHIRQGFENNMLTTEGRTATDNTQQLLSTVAALKACSVKPASIEQTRNILQIR